MNNQKTRRAIGIVGVVLLAASAATCAEPKPLPQVALAEGWISLFDGETLFGWRPSGEAKWDVADGEIRTSAQRPGFLMTTTEWGNFILYLEFKAATATNSGVFLRTPANPKNPAGDCYELNIAPADNPFPTGSFVARQKAQKLDQNQIDPESWHRLVVAAAGGTFMVVIDDEQVLSFTDQNPVRIGHIGLQSNSGAVAFRNIRLKPTGLEPLLSGSELKGWSLARAEKSKFEVTKGGELHLTNGPGQIDTDADFKNFVLQLDCKVNGDGLNSGVFFRTRRDGRWVGYESQINNTFKDGERTKPADFGTGAIYRRQPARQIAADDHQWFTKTIVADGPHMAVWVNGHQVSDWTDERPEKENAREGKKLGGGAIAIQGHDPTTDFLFRNIRAVELPR